MICSESDSEWHLPWPLAVNGCEMRWDEELMEDRVETEAYQRMMINATYAGRVPNEWE